MKKRILSIAAASTLLTGIAATQEPYKLHPKEIMDIATVLPPPEANISSSGTFMALIHSESMPSIEFTSQSLLRIAGTKIMPKYNSHQVISFKTSLTIKNIKDGTVESPLSKRGKQ